MSPDDFPRGDPFKRRADVCPVRRGNPGPGRAACRTFDTAVDLHRFLDTIKRASDTGQELPVT